MGGVESPEKIEGLNPMEAIAWVLFIACESPLPCIEAKNAPRAALKE
jgi:hypothetical protein